MRYRHPPDSRQVFGNTLYRRTSEDEHAGLTAAVAATLPGAAWQRCRTHYAADPMSTTPKRSWAWMKALLHSVYNQADAASAHAQFDRVANALAEKLPRVAEHLENATRPSSPSPRSPRRSGGRSGRTTPTHGSTRRSAAAPTWSASSPTGTRSSASSAPSWPSSTTSGPKVAATWGSTSSPENPGPRHHDRGGDHRTDPASLRGLTQPQRRITPDTQRQRT